jgi:hypothetical protein
MAISQRQPTRRDVELAEVKRKGEIQIKLAYGVVGAMWFLAATLPIIALRGLVALIFLEPSALH